MSIDHVRLASGARNQLITLKRRTGLTQWNELCRWALCRSLAEPSPPPEIEIESDASGIEMTWKVFAGAYGDVFAALLEERCRADGFATDEETLGQQLRLHLQRGISYLVGDQAVKDIAGLTARAQQYDDGQPAAAG